MKTLGACFGVAVFILAFMLGWGGGEWLAKAWSVSGATEFMLKVFGASLTCGFVLDFAKRNKGSSGESSPSPEETVGGDGGGFSVAPRRLPGEGNNINGRHF